MVKNMVKELLFLDMFEDYMDFILLIHYNNLSATSSWILMQKTAWLFTAPNFHKVNSKKSKLNIHLKCIPQFLEHYDKFAEKKTNFLFGDKQVTADF